MKPASHSPMYVVFFPELVEIARQNGYAMAVHGSVASDFDLVCIPWVEDAGEPRKVVEQIEGDFSFRAIKGPTQREHGRVVYTLSMGGPGYIDLSFTPRAGRLALSNQEPSDEAQGADHG
jgi:hypothetical protein